MCGILAQFRQNSRIKPDLFNKALKLIKHRGPDDTGHIALRNNTLYLGHNRLSIIGVDNGQQPLCNQENTLFTIINGEFYDYTQIKNELHLEGYQFRTNSDSEIILALYQKYKFNCFNKLNGEFSGILFDKQEDKLIIFRDRHGVKPLFFKRTEDGIIISSEIKSILKIDGASPEWDVDYLKQSLYWLNTQSKTLFKNIFHVKPAHYMVLDLKSNLLLEHQYWNINFNKQNYSLLSLNSLVKKYEEEFVAAVSRRLVADVNVATYLSGGIDSSACYGVASTLMGKGIDAFTISFENNDYDEFKQANNLIKKYNGKHHVLNISEKLLLDNFADHLWHMEEIVRSPSSVGKYLLSDMVFKSGYKVVITGEGSDEYNVGYMPNLIDAGKLNHNSIAKFSKHQLKIIAGNEENAIRTKELDYLKPIFGFSPSLFEYSEIVCSFFNSVLTPKFQENNISQSILNYVQPLYIQEMSNWDALNISLYLTGKTSFPYVLSVLGDRTEMAHGIESRLPFLDHNLLDFLAKVPPKYKSTPNTDKFLLRQAIKKYVTPEHYLRPKHPYIAPPTLTDKSLFANYMYDIFSSTWFANIGLFDQSKVITELNHAIKNNNVETERYLFQILSFGIMHKLFNFKNL